MKKFWQSLFNMALLVAIAVTACSCDKNDEPSVPKPDKPEVVSSRLVLTAFVNKGVMNTYDIAVTDSEGVEVPFSTDTKTVEISGIQHPLYYASYEVNSDKLPVDGDINLKFSVKEGYNVPASTDMIVYVLAMGSAQYRNAFEPMVRQKGILMNNTGVKGDKINEYAGILNEAMGHFSFTFSEEGMAQN